MCDYHRVSNHYWRENRSKVTFLKSKSSSTTCSRNIRLTYAELYTLHQPSGSADIFHSNTRQIKWRIVL